MSWLTGAALFDALESFAAAHWDFRDERERNLAQPPSLTAAQHTAIDSAAATLGLDGTPPPRRDRYDAVIMTGGMVRAGIVKPRYLRELYEGGRVVRVVAAPSSMPVHRRANTVDTFRFWASRARDIRSVLVITTPVYVAYQGAAAIEVLGLEFGMSVETVAVSDSASDLGDFSQPFLPQHRAQELRAAVHGVRSLRSHLSCLV